MHKCLWMAPRGVVRRERVETAFPHLFRVLLRYELEAVLKWLVFWVRSRDFLLILHLWCPLAKLTLSTNAASVHQTEETNLLFKRDSSLPYEDVVHRVWVMCLGHTLCTLPVLVVHIPVETREAYLRQTLWRNKGWESSLRFRFSEEVQFRPVARLATSIPLLVVPPTLHSSMRLVGNFWRKMTCPANITRCD